MINKQNTAVTKLLPFVWFTEGELKLRMEEILETLEHLGFILHWENFEEVLVRRLNKEIVGKCLPNEFTRRIICDGIVKLAEKMHIPGEAITQSYIQNKNTIKPINSFDDLSQEDKEILEHFKKKVEAGKIRPAGSF